MNMLQNTIEDRRIFFGHGIQRCVIPMLLIGIPTLFMAVMIGIDKSTTTIAQ